MHHGTDLSTSGNRSHCSNTLQNTSAMDNRFAAVHSDPRFARIAKKSKHLVPDERFRAKETDEDYSLEINAKTDKYGRKQKNKKVKNVKVRNGKKVGEDKDDETAHYDRLNRLARGEVSDSEYSSSSSSMSDDENENVEVSAASDIEDIGGDYFNENLRQHENVPLGEETRRLALVNMDWEHLKALDILALIQSFVSSTGSVSSVVVYPSEFGKKRLALENQMGPTGVYELSNSSNSSNRKSVGEHMAGSSSTTTDGSGIDLEKVRQYEKDKLKYYFAVITFDSINTASAVYNECDGLEFETSSNVLDLRFIPDDVSFSSEYRDNATTIPKSYKPPAWFATAALQQSNVSLTWDASDDERKGLVRWHTSNDDKKQMKNTIREQNLRSYLADASDEEATDNHISNNQNVGKLRNLLGLSSADEEDYDNGSVENETYITNGDNSDDEVMEITFTPGLGESFLKEKKKREMLQGETVFEKYQREKREKKKLRKKRKKHDDQLSGNSSSKNSEYLGPIKEKSTKKMDGSLKLVLMDDHNDQHSALNVKNDGQQVSSRSAIRSKKRRKRKAEAKNIDIATGSTFTINTEDPRFSAMYNDSNYAIDPTDSKFKATENMKKILQTKSRMNKKVY
jgi:hypothetical protein